MAAEKDKPDQGAAGPETSFAPINKGRAWDALERHGYNSPRDASEDDCRRAIAKKAVAERLDMPDSPNRAASASTTLSMYEEIAPEMLERIRLAMAAAAEEAKAFPRALCGGDIPSWVHRETWIQVERSHRTLSDWGLTDVEILDRAARGLEDCVACPPHAVMDAIDYLAHVRYAVSLGPEQGLEVLYGHHAAAGYGSHAGAGDGGRKAAETRRKDGNLDKRDANIRRARAHGATVAELAKRFGISERQIRNVLKGAKPPKTET